MRRITPLLAFALACADPSEPATVPNGIWSEADTWTGQVIITEDVRDPRWPSDPVTIRTAEVKGDTLELSVSFGGGCRGHTFLLLADGAWMESYPVQTGLRLAHEDNNDNCDALLTRVLKFDLVPLKVAYTNSYGPAPASIRLRIGGTSMMPLYKW
jgi:hypothetical protein